MDSFSKIRLEWVYSSIVSRQDRMKNNYERSDFLQIIAY